MSTRMWSYASRGHSVLPVARELTERTFRQRDIPGVRRVAAVFGTRAGLGPGRRQDFVQAVSEAVACAVAQGPCTARVRLWTMGSRDHASVMSGTQGVTVLLSMKVG
jgi:hypothetical protein